MVGADRQRLLEMTPSVICVRIKTDIDRHSRKWSR